jgi:hypothetical protein
MRFDVVQQPSGDYQLQFSTDELYIEIGVTWTDLETIITRITKTLEGADGA